MKRLSLLKMTWGALSIGGFGDVESLLKGCANLSIHRTHGARDSGSPYDASDVVHLGDLVPPQGSILFPPP